MNMTSDSYPIRLMPEQHAIALELGGIVNNLQAQFHSALDNFDYFISMCHKELNLPPDYTFDRTTLTFNPTPPVNDLSLITCPDAK